MFTISKSFDFSASHQLRGLPPEHPCSRLHGHNYTVTFYFAAEDVDTIGFVVDYRSLDVVKKWLDDVFDHKHINDVLPTMNPTAENLARYMYEAVRGAMKIGSFLRAVAVEETERTSAYYEPAQG